VVNKATINNCPYGFASEGARKAGAEWSLPNIPEGRVAITGRKYSEYALERMALNNPEIRAALQRKCSRFPNLLECTIFGLLNTK
jgi:hypothetical protein